MTTPVTRTHFDVPGPPRGKGRPRFNGNTGRAYTDTRTKTAETRVREAWHQADRPDLGNGPISLHLVVVVERPAGHFRTNGELNAAGIRKPVPTSKPDLDNVLKLVADSLNKLAFGDDAQIASCSVVRRWATRDEREHLEVALRRIGVSTAPSVPQDATGSPSDASDRLAV